MPNCNSNTKCWFVTNSMPTPQGLCNSCLTPRKCVWATLHLTHFSTKKMIHQCFQPNFVNLNSHITHTTPKMPYRYRNKGCICGRRMRRFGGPQRSCCLKLFKLMKIGTILFEENRYNIHVYNLLKIWPVFWTFWSEARKWKTILITKLGISFNVSGRACVISKHFPESDKFEITLNHNFSLRERLCEHSCSLYSYVCSVAFRILHKRGRWPEDVKKRLPD